MLIQYKADTLPMVTIQNLVAMYNENALKFFTFILSKITRFYTI